METFREHTVNIFVMSTIPVIVGGVGKERRIKNWPMVMPEKAAPVTGTTLRTTGPVPADSRQ